jgi:DinB family protein
MHLADSAPLSPHCHHPSTEFRMRSSRFVLSAFAAVLALAPTLSLGAQQKGLISQAALIAIVQNHKGAVLRYIDAAPDSMLGFRPTKGVRSFAEQIEHAAGSDALIAQLAITGSTKTMPPFGDSASYLHNKAALKKYSAAAMDYTIKLLQGVSDAAMEESIVQFGNKVTRARALMELLDHFPWTLGQTVPYLRLNGVTPPEYSPF